MSRVCLVIFVFRIFSALDDFSPFLSAAGETFAVLCSETHFVKDFYARMLKIFACGAIIFYENFKILFKM